MTGALFSSENQQYAVESIKVASVGIYVIPKESKLQSVYGLLVYGPDPPPMHPHDSLENPGPIEFIRVKYSEKLHNLAS